MTGGVRANDEAQIRGLIDAWAEAIRAKDVDAVMSRFAADLVTFDLAPPLQCAGAEALRRSLAACFSTFRGPVGYEVATSASRRTATWPSAAA
jgi:ketosteroid isomerase-like protein